MGYKDALHLFTQMGEYAGMGLTHLRPDRHCYKDIFYCLLRYSSPRNFEPAERAEDLLAELVSTASDQKAAAGTAHYEHVMVAWCNAEQPGGVARVLQEMVYDYEVRGNTYARPRVESFHLLIKALAYAQVSGCVDKAEAVMDRMHELYKHPSKILDAPPNAETYRHLITCCLRTKQISRAEQVLWRMDTLYKAGQLDQPASAKDFGYILLKWRETQSDERWQREEMLVNEMKKRGFL
jgi:hypothetical protein